ncbi:MAG: DUF4352 domain-containing protein [Anaerolineae bacterium]
MLATRPLPQIVLCALFVLCALALIGCTGSPAPTLTPAPTVDQAAIETRVALSIFATQTASVPTATNTPVATSTPTDTATLTPTNTPTITDTPTNTPTLTRTPLPSRTFTPRPPPATSTPRPAIPVGQDVTLGHWTYHVLAAYKDKNVWFYDETKVANGLWAVVLIQVTNAGLGTDYLANTIDFGLYDQAVRTYDHDPAAFAPDEYARWEFCGCDTIYSDINPGESQGVIMVFDVPADTQTLTLMTILDAAPTTGYRLSLGTPFAQLPMGKPKK